MTNQRPPLPTVRPPMRIYAVRLDALDQLWFTTNLKRARAVASLIARIVPAEFYVQLQTVETQLKRQYISWPEPILIDHGRTQQGFNPPYNGPIEYSTIDSYEGRGQQFTPAEKQKTFQYLKTHIEVHYWLLLAPLAPMQAMARSELPPNKALKQMMEQQQ